MGPKSVADLKRLADLRLQAADMALLRAHSDLSKAEAFTRGRIADLEDYYAEAHEIRQDRIRAVLGRPSTIAQVSRIALAYAITDDEIAAHKAAIEDAREAEQYARERLKSAQQEQARCVLRQRKLEHVAEQLAIAEASADEFHEELEAGI